MNRPCCLFPTVLLCALLSVPMHSIAASQDGSIPLLNTKGGFNGTWEKDYARSDNWERRVREKLSELRRQAEQRNRRPESRGQIGGISVISSAGRGTNIIDLARFTEMISRHHTMKIVQDEQQISIAREGEAKLICSTTGERLVTQNEFAVETCRWDGKRLIFRIQLEEGTTIYHRFLLSPAGNSINLLTRVSHPGSPAFELVQFYERFDGSYEAYQCKQTLSRGKVCNLRHDQSPETEAENND